MLPNNSPLANRSTKDNCSMWKRGKLCFTIMLFQTIIAIVLTLFSVYEETPEPSDGRDLTSPSIRRLDLKSYPIERYLPHLRDHMMSSLIGLGLSSTSSSVTMLASLGFNLLTFTFASSWGLLWPHLVTVTWESKKTKPSKGPLENSTSSNLESLISQNLTISSISSSPPLPTIKSNLSCFILLTEQDRAKIKSTTSSFRQKFHITFGINSILRSTHYGLGVTLSLGSLQDKLSPMQCIILAVIEVPIMSLTESVLSMWQVADESNGLAIYTFSVYFGLAVSMIICRNIQATRRKSQQYDSERELSVLLGTIFTYLTFPTLTSSYSLGDKKHRLAINTWISVTASCLSAFSISSLLDEKDRFSVRHLRIGSAAGGVFMSIIGQYILYPYTVFISGMTIGALSIITHVYLNPYLLNRLRIHDTLSMHATYGLPAVIAGFASSGFAFTADENSYGYTLYELFPARAPPENSEYLEKIQRTLDRVFAGIGRSANSQALYQLSGVIFTLIVSIITGLIAGILLVQRIFDPLQKIDLFQDGFYWVLSNEGEDALQNESLFEDEKISEGIDDKNNRKLSKSSAIQ